MLAALALLALCALLLVPFLLGRTADAFAPAPETRALPVVMYHSLLRDPARWGDYVVSPAQLERDLAYLQEQGYVFVTMAEVIGFVSGAGTLPKSPPCSPSTTATSTTASISPRSSPGGTPMR